MIRQRSNFYDVPLSDSQLKKIAEELVKLAQLKCSRRRLDRSLAEDLAGDELLAVIRRGKFNFDLSDNALNAAVEREVRRHKKHVELEVSLNPSEGEEKGEREAPGTSYEETLAMAKEMRLKELSRKKYPTAKEVAQNLPNTFNVRPGPKYSNGKSKKVSIPDEVELHPLFPPYKPGCPSITLNELLLMEDALGLSVSSIALYKKYNVYQRVVVSSAPGIPKETDEVVMIPDPNMNETAKALWDKALHPEPAPMNPRQRRRKRSRKMKVGKK